MFKKAMVVTLPLVMALCLTACPGGNALPSVEEILEKTNQAMEGVTSLSCDIDLDMYMIATTGTEDIKEMNEVSAELALSGVIDMENRQLQMEMDIGYGYTDLLRSSTESSISVNMGMALYLLNDVAYIMMDDPLAGESWMKYEIPADEMQQVEDILDENLTPAGMQELLMDVSQVIVEGTEKIKGVDCYVLRITLDEIKLWQRIKQEAQAMGEEIPEGADIGALLEIIQGISIRQWVARDTYHIAGIQVVLDIEMDAEDMGYIDEVGSIKIDAILDALFYDYNQPVSIVLPAGAEEAIEESTLQGIVQEANTESDDVEIAVLAAMVDNDVYELTTGGTVGPGRTSSVYAADGTTELVITPYLYSYLEATYTLDEYGCIIAAVTVTGGRWDGLTYVVYDGWVN